ncbi:MAG: hypothetical protein WC747_02285 [Candidatus Babeliales bacterium]|jgi:hypothetical protein
MNTAFIVSSYGEQIRKEKAQVLTATTFVASQIISPTDCTTGGTPKQPTPSPKANKDFCDVSFDKSVDDLFGNSALSRNSSVRDFYPRVPVSSAAVSPTSTEGKFDSVESSPSLTPALNFSVSPSTTSLPELDLIKPAEDCTTGGTPKQPTPSPKKR